MKLVTRARPQDDLLAMSRAVRQQWVLAKTEPTDVSLFILMPIVHRNAFAHALNQLHAPNPISIQTNQ